MQAQRFLAAVGKIAAATQPDHQRVRIGRIDVEHAREIAARRRGCERDHGGARRAQVEPVDRPGIAVAAQLGGEILQRSAAEHDLIATRLDAHGKRRMRNVGHQRAQGRPQAHRPGTAVARIVAGHETVGIELARRQDGVEQRSSAEAHIAAAGKFQRALLAAIAALDLVELGQRMIGLEPGGHLPRRPVLGRLAGRLAFGRRRNGERQHAIEPRRPRLETQEAVELGRGPGSMLRCTRVAPLLSFIWLEETRNG